MLWCIPIYLAVYTALLNKADHAQNMFGYWNGLKAKTARA
jgi:hypothetical protein